MNLAQLNNNPKASALSFLKEPLYSVNIDDGSSLNVVNKIIKRKKLLKHFYEQCYHFFKTVDIKLKANDLRVELGSGGGFIKEVLPHVKTSDIMESPILDFSFDALNMPFNDEEVAAIYLIDVFHHLQDVGKFLKEVERTLIGGGKLVMVEPANTFFSSFIYRNFHPEPFITKATSWQLPSGGPMSVANGALPWIVFKRDYEKFKLQFPGLKIKVFELTTPISYLLSGGLTFKQLVPDLMIPGVLITEKLLKPLYPFCAMFYKIIIEKA